MSSFKSVHTKKIKSLGLDLSVSDDNLQVVINQSSYKLSETETNLLNKGLQCRIFPDKLSNPKLEEFYQQIRPSRIKNNDRLEFKAKLMHLYSKYKFTFHYNRKHQQILKKSKLPYATSVKTTPSPCVNRTKEMVSS